MKRIITIISAIATLFLVSACTEPLGPSAKKGAYILKLDLRCGELQTRASNGDDNYHENDINFVDYFFFADEAGETPLGIHGRVTLPTEEGLTFDTSEAQYAALQHTSYVYVLANYPGEIDHTGNPTLATLLALPVNKDVYTPANENTNTPAAMADSFVMDSYDPATKKYTVELKPTTVNEERRQTIMLARLAVKVTVKMTFDDSITTTDTFGNTESWTPLPDLAEVYFVNGLNNTTVKATPVSRAQNTSGRYFTYSTDYGWDNTSSGLVYTTKPAYTYPQTWTMGDNFEPYVKLHMIWRSSVKGESHFYYKIPVASPVTTTQNSSTSTTFTLNRNCWHQIQLRVGVLGGTENDYVLLDAEYCVARWEEPSWFSGSGLNSAKYFYVPQTVFHIYGDDHIDIPYYCNADVNAYFTNITYLDYNSNSSGATATRSKTFTGTSNTSVTDYGGADNHTYSLTSDADNKVVKFVHDMTNLYVVRTITLRIANSENTNQVKEVIIHQHPAIELKKATAGDMFVNGHFARVVDARNSAGAVFGQTWAYDGQTYYHSYRQRQYQGTWYNDSDYDSYYSRYGSLYRRWNDSYWGGNYSISQSWGYTIEEITSAGYVTNTGTNGYGSINGRISSGNSTVSENYFTTDITVTAFSSTNNTYTIAGEGNVAYKIGDPRVKASSVYSNFSLNPYLSAINNNGRQQVTTDWDTPGDIMICSPADNDRNIIAPRILISSGLTELLVGHIPDEFINFVKRGATFQEAGYPAGRWRLPTEGEVAFIAARQFDGTIPDIFNRDVPYYCASGRWVIVPSEGTTLTFGTDINQVIHVWEQDYTISELLDAKFVYDLWYWGDQPANTTYVTNQYHPNGHVVPYK